ncbi:MAG: 4-hydroxy-tetrahydrodipicolinate synthase [Candidatus Margulisbacteria bacterium]|nr:4-hydroxy-tetrahydrodipicolinate synthase [Candidatus Margulisiibacteriota bacterium]MBU1021383.1 4-hydroxy-tetrahydrodipicolinate synthase [Candidatus Margulisiibacteriota bacterium]MBU1729128.1 4-hydroxy-tetrahydrodipicolinate synthase [Candidatus Margulisiibacteriota bacterium]MBU1954801.1 4-hydroxy-tetrahydrodipicolinate synthase [Candidatus Margulisiibacteriota bacterium]
MLNFGNVLTAMVTPFKKDLSVDYALAEKLAVHLAENGSDGIVVHGTTGESPTLTHEEEFELYKVVLKAVKGKAKVVAGTGSNSTATAVEMTKKAEKLGVDGAMIVAPYYNKPSQDGLYAHFKAIADATALPLIIYNIPGRTGINMLPPLISRLAGIKNYVVLKDAAGNLDQTSATKELVPQNFQILSGDDSLTLPMMAVGAEGVISVASHIAGKEIKQMVISFLAGDVKKAEALHYKLLPLFKVLFITSNPVPVKAALEMIGFPVGGPRLPLVPLLTDQKNKVEKVLKDLGKI